MYRWILGVEAFALALSAQGQDDGLVGYWTFDDGDGDTAVDSSGNGNDGALVRGPEWVDGQFGGALRFDGTQRHKVEVPHSDSFGTITTGVTLEAWVNPANFNSWVSFGVKGDITYGMFINPSAFVRIHYSGGTTLDTAASILAANEWTHVVGTYDGAHARIYINGEMEAEIASALPVPAGTAAFVIGGTLESRDWYTGMLDEVRLYNRGLTEDEVRANMAGPTRAVEPRGKLATMWSRVKLTGVR
ncbi:MAG: LamG domain-containing protein [Candidatus Poribacteria bacterium]|nr:LamG domain-containing protein [Candidatus Poribacteria bacterium]